MANDDTDFFAQMLDAAHAGHGWAFTRIFEQHEPEVAGFVRSRGVADADDVVNEVFLAAFNGIRSFTGGASDLRAWIFRITRNKVSDWYREIERQRKRADGSADALRVDGGTGEEQVAVVGSLRVEDLLSRLTEDQREVLLLRVIAGLTGPETAKVLDKPLTAVKALQRRGLETLRREISSEAVSN